MPEGPDLKLRFAGHLVQQLGAQLYPSATATVAELISNAWDADARHVWVSMPFGDWSNGEITVTDDGSGMTEHEAGKQYLVVGINRRKRGQRTADRNRLVHGRKGIGKLAAFGTAQILEVKTKTEQSDFVAFRLDYEKIRAQDPATPYRVQASEDREPLTNPDSGELLEHGTRIRLTGLRLKRRLQSEDFQRSMARRFALASDEMVVKINGIPLERFAIDVEFRFPQDGAPPGVEIDDGGWAREMLEGHGEVRWWIGFTEKPLRKDAQQGISVLVRGKLAQRPFKFDRTQNVRGELGQEYLVGEVVADWIDDEAETGEGDDYIQSNRDQLQLEDEDLAAFVKWGQRRLNWTLGKWTELRSEKATANFRAPGPLKSLLDPLSPVEQRALTQVAASLAQAGELGDQRVQEVMRDVLDARESGLVRGVIERMEVDGALSKARFWELVEDLGAIDARRVTSLVEGRLHALDQLLEENASPPDVPPRTLAQNLWLVDPRWDSFVVEQDRSADGRVTLLMAPGGDEHESGPTCLVWFSRDPEKADGEFLDQLQADVRVPLELVACILPTDEAAESLAAMVSSEAPFQFSTWVSALERNRMLLKGWRAAAVARTEQA